MTTGAAATSRSVREFIAVATRNNITPTKNTRRPSRPRSRNAQDLGATLDDLREAVSTLEDTERIARRVLGNAHPMALKIERNLQDAREILAARETPPPQA